MTIPEEYLELTQRDSRGGFSLHNEWIEKCHPKPFSYYHQKAAFYKWKMAFVYWNPIFCSLCRWRSKLKYILLCNEDLINTQSHKKESDYTHCNWCPVYSADCITSYKVLLRYTPLLSTADNNLDISWEMTSSRTLHLWTIWCQDWWLVWKPSHSVKDKNIPSVHKKLMKTTYSANKSKAYRQSICVACYKRERTTA